MHDESISQAEIDALVHGLTGKNDKPAPLTGGGDDTAALLKEILKAFAQQAGQALSDLVGVPCRAELTTVQDTTCQGAQGQVSGQVVIGRCALASGLPGSFYWVVPLPVAFAMITQIYGGVSPSTLDDSALAALSDGLAQMNQAGALRLGEVLGRAVYAGPVEVLTTGSLSDVAGLASGAHVLAAAITLQFGEESGPVLLVLPPSVTAPLAQVQRERQARSTMAPTPAPAPAPNLAAQAPVAQIPPAVAALAAAAAAPAPPAPAPYNAQPARFPEVAPRTTREEIRNIDLLMDVSLQVTVELGRTRKQIREVLSLGPGSVIELDKLAGEQVDVLVNGKLIAKGEVVVIDENYGVRITDIISPVERVQTFR